MMPIAAPLRALGRVFGLTACLTACQACGSSTALPARVPSSSYELTLDPSLSELLVGATLEAAHAWEVSVPVQFVIDHAPCADGQPLEYQICVMYDPTGGPTGSGELGWTQWWVAYNSAIVRIYPGAESIVMAVPTLGHELGHAMGLTHRSGPYLMAPALDGTVTSPTDGDVQQWKEMRE